MSNNKEDIFQFAPFLFLNEHENKYNLQMIEILKKKDNPNFDTLTVRNLFFSPQNLDIVQKQLILHIYKVSKKTFLIKRQDNDTVMNVMKWVYYEYGRNLPYDITEQIRDLNNKVVEQITPQILTYAQQYVGYIYDSNSRIRPIDRPLNLSSKGSRTLPSVTKTFFE